MTLLFLLLVLVVPYFLLTLVGRWRPGWALAAMPRGRVGLSLFFLVTASGHFFRTEAMAQMVPTFVPYRVQIVYLTGALEIAGAVGLWIPGLVQLTGVCLILMLLGLLPANIYSAFNHVDFGGHGAGPIYLLVRVPFQLFVLWWIYWSTGQRWFSRGKKSS
jgi:uncharacterized membrane protein